MYSHPHFCLSAPPGLESSSQKRKIRRLKLAAFRPCILPCAMPKQPLRDRLQCTIYLYDAIPAVPRFPRFQAEVSVQTDAGFKSDVSVQTPGCSSWFDLTFSHVEAGIQTDCVERAEVATPCDFRMSGQGEAQGDAAGSSTVVSSTVGSSPVVSSAVDSTLCHTHSYESAVGSSTVGSSAVWSSADVVGSSVVGISSAAVGSSIVGSSMVGSSSAAVGSAVGSSTVGSAVGSAGLQKKNVRFAPEGTAHQKLVPHEVAHKSKDAANHNPSSSSSSSVGSSAVGRSADAVGSSIVGSSMVGSSSAAVGSAVGSSTVGRAVGSAVVWSSADAVGSSSAVGSSTVRSAVGSSTVRSSADATVDAVGSSTVGSSAVGSSAVWSSADAVGSSTTGSLANAVGSSTVGSSAVGSSADAVGSSAVGCSVDAVGSSIVGSPADAAGSSAVGSSTARARENPSDVSVPDPQPDRSSDHPELKRMTDKFVEYFLARDNHPQGYARTVSRLLRQTDEELTTSYCNMVGRLRDLGIPSTGRLHSTRRVLTAMTHAIQSVADGENPKEIALNMQEDMLSDSDAEPPSPESLQICCQNPSVKSRRKGRNRNRGKSSKT